MASEPPATEQAEKGEEPVVAWLQFRNDREDCSEGSIAAWERLRAADEAILEAHFQGKGKSTAIFGGRWEAHLGDAAPAGGEADGGGAPVQEAEAASARAGASREEAAEAAVAATASKSAAAASMGSIRARYYDEADRQLTRSTWCYRYWPHGQWAPFCNADDVALERLWTSVNAAAVKEGEGGEERAREHTTADGQHVVRLVLQPDGQLAVGMRAVETSWNPFQNLSWYAHRGWCGAALPAVSELEAEYEARPAEALVLVVHGMGEAFWSTHKSIGSIRDACVAMRALAAATAAQQQAELARGGGGTGGVRGRVEFLPIEWYTCLRGGDSTMQTLRLVTPPSVPYLRQIANDVVMDVLFYQQDSHRRRMQSFVADRMNATVATWREHHPSFCGPILILGHSLGSLICFDLLEPASGPDLDQDTTTPPPQSPQSTLAPAAPPPSEHTAYDETPSAAAAAAPSAPPPSPPALHFRPEAFVGIGSPVGCFLSLRGDPLGLTFSLRRTDRYFNVYHRNDVVAYRVEPLLVSPGGQAGHPAYVPFFGGGADGKRLHVKLKQTVRSMTKAAVSVQSWLSSSSSLKDKVLAAAQAIDGATISSFVRPAEQGGAAEAEAAGQARREPYALNRGEPVDWVLQETEFEAANEYLSAAAAHTSYFDNADVAAFLLRHVLGGAARSPTPINRRESM